MKELKKNTNKQLNKIRTTVQDMKIEFNKDTEILTKDQNEILKMKYSVSQIKNSVESLQ
jgi:hypothetical protein